MSIRTFRAVVTALVLAVGAQGFGKAQAPAIPLPQSFSPTSVIPLDSAVTNGTLPNGLRYYVRKNARQELIATFESTGARLGPHVNAQTGFDDTIYMFQLPTDRAGIVEKGVQALADFAGGMTLDPKEIDKERGVVIAGERAQLGGGHRAAHQEALAEVAA